MNHSEIVLAVLLLSVFVAVPVVLALIANRLPINLSLQECPNCGAQNHKDKEHCYCCGFGFYPDSAGEQADVSKMRRRAGTQAVEGMS